MAHQDHSADNQDGGEDFLPAEVVEADCDADDGGEDGLQVGVHAHEGGADALLAVGDEEIGEEGREED